MPCTTPQIHKKKFCQKPFPLIMYDKNGGWIAANGVENGGSIASSK
jgi:hypothetical protein